VPRPSSCRSRTQCSTWCSPPCRCGTGRIPRPGSPRSAECSRWMVRSSSPTSFQGIRTQSGCSHAAPTPRPDPNRPRQDAGPSPPGRCRLQSHPLVPITGRPGHRRPEDDHDPPPKVSLKRSSLDARAAMTVRVTGSSMACKRPGSRLCCSNLATSLRRPVGHCRRRGTDPSSHEIPPSPGPARELAGQAGPDEPRRRAG
jgi:hypothetical protein